MLFRSVLDALVGVNASETTRESLRRKLRAGELDDKEIEIQVADGGLPHFDIPGLQGGSAGLSSENTRVTRG